jgi:hypothetical protein
MIPFVFSFFHSVLGMVCSICMGAILMVALIVATAAKVKGTREEAQYLGRN